MHLTKVFIDGFGVFRDYQVDDLHPGMVVVFGPNEAGKSTLLAFLRGMLFGFPRRSKNRRPAYPALAGGRHGGRVFAETAGGSVAIEREVGRTAARITLASPEGGYSELTDAEFQQLIGGVDEQTFNTVFAFTLDELRDFETLTGEQVKARIFAAGVGGAGPSARDVIGRLERKLSQLLKPRSLEGDINKILDDISGCEAELSAARSRTESYPAMLEEQAVLAARVQALEQREVELRALQTKSERLLELWPAWVDIEQSREELDGLDPVDEFIPEAIRRLDEARDRLAEAQAGLQRLLDRKARNDEEASRLREDAFDALWALAPAIDERVAGLSRYQDLVEQKTALQAQVALTDDRLGRRLREVDPLLDEAVLEKVDTSLPRLEEVRALRVRLESAATRATLAVHSLDSAREAKKQAERECDDEREALKALPQVDLESLGEQSRHLRMLRAGMTELRAAEAALEGRRTASAGLAAPLAAPARPPLWAVVASASVGIALAVAAALMGVFSPMTTVAVGVGVLAVLCVALAVGLVLWRARASHVSRDLEERAEAFRREKSEQAEMHDVVMGLKTRLLPIAAALGVEDLRDPHEVEAVEAALLEMQQQAAVLKEQTVTTVRAEGRLRKAAESEAIAETRLSRAREEEAARRMEFRAAMSDWGLPDTLSPEGVEEYLRGLATAKESAEQKKAEVAALERVLAEMHVWEAESTAVLAAARAAVAQRAELSEDDFHEGYGDETERLDIESALLALAEACRNERAVRERIAELEGESSRLEDEVSDARTAAEKAEEGLKDLFMRAGVDDEEGFLARHATYERRQELQQAVRLGEETLVKSVGKGEQAEQLRAALATGDVSQWEADLARVRSELDELRFERAEAIKDEGDVERRLSELEVSADVPSLESAFEALQTGLSTAMEEWRVNRLAAHIIGETLTRFTVERQPQVLAEASELFHRVTEGAYVQVRLATEEEGIVVEGIDGQIKYPDQLSRGTAEQLYLCLRLALAEEFARRAEPIPLIMDEVLVNFDSVRRGRMAELLLDFAKRHQILFFTCHESVVELMQGADPSVRTIILS